MTPANSTKYPTDSKPTNKAQKTPKRKSPPPNDIFKIIGTIKIINTIIIAIKSENKSIDVYHLMKKSNKIDGNITLSGIRKLLISI